MNEVTESVLTNVRFWKIFYNLKQLVPVQNVPTALASGIASSNFLKIIVQRVLAVPDPPFQETRMRQPVLDSLLRSSQKLATTKLLVVEA